MAGGDGNAAELAPSLRARLPLDEDPDFDQLIEELWQAARAEWPEFSVAPDDLAGLLVEKLAEPSQDAVAALPIGELYLVAACLAGDRRAIAAFESRYFSHLGPALQRMKLSSETVKEVISGVREKLYLAGADGVIPLRSYCGRSDLEALARVIATRIALDKLRQREPPGEQSDQARDLTAPISGPELHLLKQQQRIELNLAFADAAAALTPQERNLLRLSFVDGLTVEEVGDLYHLHRVSAARRLARAKQRLADLTRELLRERLQLESGEFTQIFELVRTQLDLSISQLLKTRS